VLRRDWEWLATLLEVSDDFPVKLKCIAKLQIEPVMPRPPYDRSHYFSVHCPLFDGMVGRAASATKTVNIVDTVELMVDHFDQLRRQIREASGGVAKQDLGFFGGKSSG
jgi:hypothetical protein